jgi:hypothetical protein
LTETASKPLSGGQGTLRVDLAVALAVVLFGILLAASDGFARLSDAQGDNDSLLRLVQVRDLLAGQGWFDPMQYRMGLEGGFPMHWSRLVDAPIAALVRLASVLTGSVPLGEVVALVLWPSLLLGAGAFLIARTARIAYGPEAAFPAFVVGAMALVSIGVFQPGAIDHHNIQLVLTLGVALGLVAGGFVPAAAAGACAALTLAIGMETLPYVAVGGAVAAGLFLARGEAEHGTAAGFGLGFAIVAAAAFVATVPPSRWGLPACDAYSGSMALLAVVAGLGLTLVAASTARSGPAVRIAALGGLAVALGALVLVVMPACLADPYATLDPRLQRYWLSAVGEAQPITSVIANQPHLLLAYFVTPLLGLAVLAVRLRRAQGVMVVAAVLAAAVLVSLWQIRGAMFAVPIAAVPLAAWVGLLRHKASGSDLRPVLAWLVSINLVWAGAGSALAARSAATGAAGSECYSAADYAQLARLAPGRVLAVSNLGSAILRHTGHSVLAGPYHRNVAGNLAVLDMMMAPAAEGSAKAAAGGIALIAHCPGNAEAETLAGWAPGSLAAQLMSGEAPAGFEPVSEPGAALVIFLRQPGG